jgi:hypothetical protein
MACMCGDLYCRSCGPAQGNSFCQNCGRWTDEGGCFEPEVCDAELQKCEEAFYQQWAAEQEEFEQMQREQVVKGHVWNEVR